MLIIDYADVIKEEAKFNEAYGAALVKWGIIEQRVCLWFIYLTQMPEDMARSIFYQGVTSFSSRLRMLRCAINTFEMSDDLRKCLKTIVSKCQDYSSTRNQLSHCQTKYDFNKNSPTFKQLIFLEGSNSIDTAEPALVINQLPIIRKNFSELGTLIMHVYEAVLTHDSKRLEEFRKQIHRLPLEAQDTQVNPNALHI